MSGGTPILRVDLAGAVPVYRQIVDQLRILLVSGALKAGDQLPTVRQVASDLGVHHNTVAEAYRQLAEEGWLDLRRRRGACVVQRGNPAADPEAMAGFERRVEELVADAIARGCAAWRGGAGAEGGGGGTGKQRRVMNETLGYALPLGMAVVVLGFATAMMALLPRFMRPDVFFSVTVSPEFGQSEEGRRIRQQFQRRVVLSGCGAMALILVLFPVMSEVGRGLAAAAGVFWLVGVTIWAFVRANGQARPHAVKPTSVREAGLTPREGLPVGLGAVLGGPLLIIAAAVVFLALRYDSLPERIPMHYNAAGEVNRYAEKSVGAVFGMPMVAVVCNLMFGLITWSMGRGMKRARASGPTAAWESGMLRLTMAILLVVQYAVAMLFSAIAVVIVLPPEVAGKWVMVLAVAGVIAMLGLVMGVLLRYRSVVATAEAGERAPVGDGTPDANWKWGMIYYNPDDPALWVEKRFGIGYTTNMARPAAWVLVGGIVLSLVAIVMVAMWAGG